MRTLDGIETGYEPAFDFPLRDAPVTTPYLFATIPRTGSTYLSHLLWESGCLGAPLEYVNFVAGGPYGHLDGDADAQVRQWRHVLRARTSPNGVFGLKCFPTQFLNLQNSNLPLLRQVFRDLFGTGHARRVVWLGRRDRTAHAISHARAMLSGIWRWEQEREGRPAVGFSSQALASAQRLIVQEEQAWDAMFADMAIDPLRLWYEDVVADPHGAITAVANYLRVTVAPEARVRVPEVRRQSTAEAEEWREALRTQ